MILMYRYQIIIINDMKTMHEEVIDFDRLLMKTNSKIDHKVSSPPFSRTQPAPLELIKSLTTQFKAHFQQIKTDLTQRVKTSDRQMEELQQTKREMKKQDQQEVFTNVPSIPIQVYDWKNQKLTESPKKGYKEAKTKSTRVPPRQEQTQEKVQVSKKTVTFKQPNSIMDKFIYTKRFQKYMDQKNYGNSSRDILKEQDKKSRDIKEEGNLLALPHEFQDQQSKFQQGESILLNDKSQTQFTHGPSNILKFVKKHEYEYRKQAFKNILQVGRIGDNNVTKDSIARYLFDHVVMMMLYSINPERLVEQVGNYFTQIPNQMNFVELSNFLLTPRQPPTAEAYQQQNIDMAELTSFKDGKVTQPVIPFITWLDSDEVIEEMLNCFQYVDIFGRRKVSTQDLINKLLKHSKQNNLLGKEVMYITQIQKPICLQKLLYEIENEYPRRKEWTYDSFRNYFYDYRKLSIIPRQQVIQNKMVEGDLEWTLLVSSSVLTVLRQTFNSCPRYSESYVNKLEYLDSIYSNSNFEKIKGLDVRRSPYMDVGLETVQQTLARLYYEGDQYLDIDQIIDFFTNRGRPFLVHDKIKARNSELQMLKIQYEQMERQNQNSKDSQDEDIQYSILRQEKKRQEFKSRQAKTIVIKEKMKSITVPIPFEFGEVKTDTIRQRKLKQMLQQKQIQIKEDLKPIVVAKQVPWFVKQNLYQRLKLEKESLSRRRLEARRTYLQSQMRPPPERLTEPLQRGQNINTRPKDTYQFISRPMPWYCQIQLLDRINRDKLQRKERIKKQLQERDLEDGTPQGIKNMMERQRILKQKWNNKNRNKHTQSLDKFEPIKIKPVPDFQKIFRQNGIQLEVRERRSKQQHHIQTWEEHKKKKVLFKNKQEAPPAPAKSTQKFDALVQLRRKQRLEQLMKKQQIEQQQRVRHLAQQKLAPKVKAVLKRMQQQHQNQLQRLRRETDPHQEQNERKQWYQMTMYQVYKKVMDRPLLIQTMNQPRISDNSQIQQLPQHGDGEKRSKKLREKPIKKVLRRTDNRNKNLQQRHPLQDQRYDDDHYQDNEDQQESQSFEKYGINEQEKKDFLEKQRKQYEQQLKREQIKHRLLHPEQYEYQEDYDDDDEGDHINNHSF